MASPPWLLCVCSCLSIPTAPAVIQSAAKDLGFALQERQPHKGEEVTFAFPKFMLFPAFYLSTYQHINVSTSPLTQYGRTSLSCSGLLVSLGGRTDAGLTIQFVKYGVTNSSGKENLSGLCHDRWFWYEIIVEYTKL